MAFSIYHHRDIDTQRNLSEFFGRTKITRIQKTTPKGKPDIREEEIELIEDNVIKMLEIGNHITYMPKDRGTLYVGYTRYPDIPKTQEGYLRQGHETENGFIRFKQNLLTSPKAQRDTQPRPPEVLYYIVPDKNLVYILKEGVKSKEGEYLALFNDTESIIDLLDTDPDKFQGMSLILQINIKQMIADGYKVIGNQKGKWFTKEIPSQYISVLK